MDRPFPGIGDRLPPAEHRHGTEPVPRTERQYGTARDQRVRGRNEPYSKTEPVRDILPTGNCAAVHFEDNNSLTFEVRGMSVQHPTEDESLQRLRTGAPGAWDRFLSENRARLRRMIALRLDRRLLGSLKQRPG
jgi:hypothetical protein